MSALTAAFVTLIAFTLLPLATRSQLLEGASPRVLAAADLVGLCTWAVLPAASAACFAAGIYNLVSGGGSSRGSGCWLGVSAWDWRLFGVGLAALAVTPLLAQAARVSWRLRHARLRGLSLRAVGRVVTTSGSTVLVLPADEKLAFAVGLWRPQAVVSRGVLVGLGPEEKTAVLEHEAAHSRLGHSALVAVAAVVSGAYGWLPPVRWLDSALRRELEAAADREAARFVSKASLLSALLSLCQSQTRLPAAPAMADPEHVRYRVRRLTAQPGRLRISSVGVASLTAALAALLAWSLCAFIYPHPTPAPLLLCLLGITVIASRPAWRLGKPQKTGAEGQHID